MNGVKPKFMSADLEEKISRAEELMESCGLCERNCDANRAKGSKGYCRVGKARVSSHFMHYGEEKQIIPSFTIFFSGCNFNCVYCQNWRISQHPRRGKIISPERMASLIDQAYWRGAKNVNWVGGEPTPNLLFILNTLKHVEEPTPVIWNSNFYMTEDCLEVLDGVVDVYLSDFKYGNDECAEKLSNVKDYSRVVRRNHLIADKQADLMVRHLVLPGHFECCTKPVLDWVSENLGAKVFVNVMGQYRPEYEAEDYEKIDEPIGREEFDNARRYAKKLGLNTDP